LVSELSHVIPFPLRPRAGLSELEILEGTLVTVLGRRDDLDELGAETIHSVLMTLNTVVGWLEEREID